MNCTKLTDAIVLTTFTLLITIILGGCASSRKQDEAVIDMAKYTAEMNGCISGMYILFLRNYKTENDIPGPAKYFALQECNHHVQEKYLKKDDENLFLNQ